VTRVIGTTATSELSLHRSAVVAGVGILLISVLAGLANFGAVDTLVTGGDATKTAQDILASKGTFRLAIAAFVIVAVLDVAWGLYAFFKPVNREVALLAGWLRLAMPRSSRSRSANSLVPSTCSATPTTCAPSPGPAPHPGPSEDHRLPRHLDRQAGPLRHPICC
jgi:uncharacterized protein DUF4386